MPWDLEGIIHRFKHYLISDLNLENGIQSRRKPITQPKKNQKPATIHEIIYWNSTKPSEFEVTIIRLGCQWNNRNAESSIFNQIHIRVHAGHLDEIPHGGWSTVLSTSKDFYLQSVLWPIKSCPILRGDYRKAKMKQFLTSFRTSRTE